MLYGARGGWRRLRVWAAVGALATRVGHLGQFGKCKVLVTCLGALRTHTTAGCPPLLPPRGCFFRHVHLCCHACSQNPNFSHILCAWVPLASARPHRWWYSMQGCTGTTTTQCACVSTLIRYRHCKMGHMRAVCVQ